MSSSLILLLIGVFKIASVQGYVTYTYDERNGKQYHISNEHEPFNLAKMNGRCKEIGGYLVEIEDYGEYMFVQRVINFVRGRGPFFTGLTDEQHEGRFLNYNDKTPAKYLRWRWFQPDNWYGEDCVEIGYRGSFNDIGCEKWGRYICEVPK